MFAQYHALKARNPDALLLFRMGDFYEAFFEDAVTLARVAEDGHPRFVWLLLDGGGAVARDEVRRAEDGHRVDRGEAEQEQDREIRPFHWGGERIVIGGMTS